MTVSEDRIVKLLASEWQEGLRITTIPQAMARLGVSDDEETRWRIARRVERVWRRRLGWRSLWRGLRWLRRIGSHPLRTWLSSFGRLPSMVTEAREWNPAVYTLSNDEKLMARHILGLGEAPAPDEIRTALDLERETVETGLRVLARLGFLTSTAGGYRLASGHERFLAGLGFNFHTVTLENGERFNVPCAIDFLLLVSSRYVDQRVVVDDACAHCTDRIRLVFNRGELAEASPPETYVYRGGG